MFFNNIVRPKPVAYEYAEMENSCHFGWFFKESNITGSLRSGCRLERFSCGAPQGVKKIRLTGRITSKWSTKTYLHGASRSRLMCRLLGKAPLI